MMPAGDPDTRELAEELARIARELDFAEALVYTGIGPVLERRYYVDIRHRLTGVSLGRIAVEPDGAVHAG